MGWSGNFKLKYKGNNPEMFHKLSKMIIPNSIERFNFDDCKITSDSVELLCTRNLRWYSADEDMKRLISYMPDDARLNMKIDGEGEYEEVVISKLNNEITFKNSNEDSERYLSDDIGIPETLYQDLSPIYGTDSNGVSICSLNGYVTFIANNFANDKKLLPIVQRFMYEVLDKDKITSFCSDWNDKDKISSDDLKKLDELRNNFSSIEKTNKFLNSLKRDDISFSSKKAQNINDLPEWVRKYPDSVINALGGANLLKKLIETEGEVKARQMIEFLGDGILEEQGMEDSYDEFYVGKGHI